MARADKAKAEGKIEFYKRAEILNATYQVTLKKAHTLKESGEDKWEEFKVIIETAWKEVKDMLNIGDSKPR